MSIFNTLTTKLIEIPESLNTENFHFRMLNETIASLDYEAVMSSQKRLQGIFGFDSTWPASDMTLTENIVSLKVHKQEFDSRQAFAYSVFNVSKDKCLGSVYIDPSKSSLYDCEVYLWIRDDSMELDHVLYQTVIKWLSEQWLFSKVAYPGRSVSWDDWQKMLDAK